MDSWPQISNAAEVPSPALLLYPDRIDENLRRMVAMAGDASRLRPHVKTHKLPQVVEMSLRHGIRRFKAATIAECHMAAGAGAADVLLAYQPVGPDVDRLIRLAQRHPGCRFSCLIDNAESLRALSDAATNAAVTLDVLLDLNVGMNRTGIVIGEPAAALYRAISTAPGLHAAGFHAYDGHLHDESSERLAGAVNATFAAVWRLRDALIASGFDVPRIVAGGTPTSGFLARHPGVEVGAGTTVLWDAGQAQPCPGAGFLPAAVLLMRIVSKPTPGRLCLDLGHKAVASEMPHPRVKLLGLEDASFERHSEEHLVVQTPRAGEFPVGHVFYGIPTHVCPTVALHSEVAVVRRGRVSEWWPVGARGRRPVI
jgi:D-serine deaminase-like pyridoxal phosphate-dependent protein